MQFFNAAYHSEEEKSSVRPPNSSSFRSSSVPSSSSSPVPSSSSSPVHRANELITGLADINRKAYGLSLENKDVVLMLGNTGAGKSTFVNYMAGRRLVAVSKNMRQVIDCEDPVVKIGHGVATSETAEPDFYVGEGDTEGLVLCDCPGFMDTRGAQIEVKNAYSLKLLAERSGGVKAIFIFVNYHTLLADRAKNLQVTAKIMREFLGHEVSRCCDSIYLMVTQYPAMQQPPLRKEDVIAFIREGIDEGKQGSSEDLSVVENVLDLGHLCLVDPLERTPQNSLSRADLIQLIQRSPGIGRSHAFHLSLSSEGKEALSAVASDLCAHIISRLGASEYELAGSYYSTLLELKKLEHSGIELQANNISTTIREHINAMMAYDNKAPALETMKSFFPEEFHESIDAAINAIKARVEDKEKIEREIQEAKQSAEEFKSQMIETRNELDEQRHQAELARRDNEALQERLKNTEERSDQMLNEIREANRRAEEADQRVRETEERLRDLESQKSESSGGGGWIISWPWFWGGGYYL
jgi:energy-coupling factor transporter ATP-binding protein EcfA2